MKRTTIAVVVALSMLLAASPASAHSVPVHCNPAHGIQSDGFGYGHSTSRQNIALNLWKVTHKHYTRNVAKGTWAYHGTTYDYCYY